MERNTRRSFVGKVISTKNEKTIVVLVLNDVQDKKYKKTIAHSKKYHAHDELQEAEVNDLVEIMETRPLSATKKFRLVKILKKAEKVEA
ncbi:MAG: 30S ribosomal protein S17 [Bacillales bacterium]|jgi:small subunit ribosomal protein S17|nr:30S ribosomal protein S17 [Bacillales bacterium]